MFVAEVAPLAPALIPLGELVACLVALGLVWTASVWVKALFGVAQSAVGWIPWVGGKAKGSLHSIEQRINHALTGVVGGLQGAVASSWHQLGRSLAWALATMVDLAVAYHKLAWLVTVKYPLHVIGYTAHRAYDLVRALDGPAAKTIRTIRTIERIVSRPATGPIAAGARVATRPLAGELHALNRWAHARVRALEHSIAVTFPGQLGALRARERQLERAYEALRKRVGATAQAVGVSGAAAILAYGLARLGAGWIRCTKMRSAGRGVCAMDPDLLDALLVGTLAVVGTVSIRELTIGLQAVSDETSAAVLGFIREA